MSTNFTSIFSLDRFGADGLERLKHLTPDTVISETSTHILGAEQERYQAHFGLSNPERVKEGVNKILKKKGVGAEQEVYAGKFILGYDGKQRMKKMLNVKGVGAEQDRYDGYFGMSPEAVERAKKMADNVKNNVRS